LPVVVPVWVPLQDQIMVAEVELAVFLLPLDMLSQQELHIVW
jgi:hypothetical protein